MRASSPRATNLIADQQFAAVLLHLRILIVLLGFVVSILVAFAWEYLCNQPDRPGALKSQAFRRAPSDVEWLFGLLGGVFVIGSGPQVQPPP
jgi:hypothetical protein